MRQWLLRQFRPPPEAEDSTPFCRLFRNRGRGISHDDLIEFVTHGSGSFHSRPNAMDVVVILQGLEKLARVPALFIGQIRKTFRDISELAGANRPAVRREPLSDGVEITALGNKARADHALRNV